MEANKHPFHSIDYEYLRPSKKYCVQKSVEDEFTHYKGAPVYRNLYYGTKVPKDQIEGTNAFTGFIKSGLADSTIKPHVPEFWSYHDSWRFADAASYKKEDMVRDIVNHSPWLEEMKNFNLSAGAAKCLTEGHIYVYGRDKAGYTNIYVDLGKCDTSKAGIEFVKDALVFLSAVVKKYMLLPYYAELFNIIIDICNKSVFSLSKDLVQGIMGIHQLHWKNNMFKLIIYNPSFTFYALWKIVSTFYNKKYLERVRIVKKGNEKDLWEIMDPKLTPQRLKGEAPDLAAPFWPPKQVELDCVTVEDIKKNGWMTFDFIGHHADTAFFKSYTPWEPKVAPNAMQWDTFGKGKLDKVYFE
jgi:hypothetical protein